MINWTEIADGLDKCAADVERPGGWQQGHTGASYLPDAPVCAAGAIDRHFSEVEGWLHARNALSAVVRTPRIAVWNDRHGRTAGEVADAFRTAACVARNTALRG